MDPIQDELKQLLEERKKTEAGVATAGNALANSQLALNQAKASRNNVTQLLTPVQQLANDLDASHVALEKQRKFAGSEIDEAGKFYDEVFPLVAKEVDPEKRATLEKVEVYILELGKSNSALQLKIEEVKDAQKTAQSQCTAADSLVRDWSAQLRGLGNQIQRARQRVSTLLAAARNAFAAGHTGETFVQLRDLHTQALDLIKLADPNTEENLHGAIENAWEQGKAARLDATEKAGALTKLTKDLAAIEAELEGKRREAVDVRASLAAEK
jgi:hypothetical protein